MTDKVEIVGSPEEHRIPVRRRRTSGSQMDSVTITLPKDLHQTINGIVVTDEKSRSLVITELLRAGLATYNVVLTTEEEA